MKTSRVLGVSFAIASNFIAKCKVLSIMPLEQAEMEEMAQSRTECAEISFASVVAVLECKFNFAVLPAGSEIA